MKARFESAPRRLPDSPVVVLGDNVVLLKTCDSAMFFFETNMLLGGFLLHPSIESTENTVSFGFRRAKVELVNHCNQSLIMRGMSALSMSLEVRNAKHPASPLWWRE